MQETQLETARTSGQLGATLATLNALTKQTKGDLRPTMSNSAGGDQDPDGGGHDAHRAQ